MSDEPMNDQSEANAGAGELRYLSDEWMAAADALLSAFDPLEETVRVGFAVSDGPEGDRNYVLRLGPDSVGLEAGATEAPVTMKMSWDIAVAIASSAMSAQRAFLDGQIQLGGDAQHLVGHATAMAVADERLDQLRDRTTF